MLFAAGLATLIGASIQRAGLGDAAFCAFCIGLVIAGALSSVVGILQVFAPNWTDGNWIATSVLDGRATGNLRQPNHLSSLLLWSIIAAVWLGERRVLNRIAAVLLVLLFVFVVVLSGSRTGAVGAALLAVWGVVDGRLSRRARLLLLLMPVAYALFWFGTSAWADHGHHVFGGETRFSGKGDVSSSRFGIWANTWALIKAHPWWGVGFGEFNFAWTLTPFPGRPVAFFDHTHNLPLQFAVELGLPLATLLMALLLWALVDAFRIAWLRAPSGAARRAEARFTATTNTASGAMSDPSLDAGQRAPVQRAAFVMVLMVTVHSLLEYPLWYAYFLLPACFAFGLCLGGRAPSKGAGHAPAAPRAARALVAASVILMAGGLYSVVDYLRVVIIFAPIDDSVPLAKRITDGTHSTFFAHHAEYAAATTAEHPADTMHSFSIAGHYLLDTRLMMTWARALAEAGDLERARHIAARLREFHNEASTEFFAPCDAAAKKPPAPAKLPFQCEAPTKAMDYRDFR